MECKIYWEINYLHSPVTGEKGKNNSTILLSNGLRLKNRSVGHKIKVPNRYMNNKIVPESKSFFGNLKHWYIEASYSKENLFTLFNTELHYS